MKMQNRLLGACATCSGGSGNACQAESLQLDMGLGRGGQSALTGRTTGSWAAKDSLVTGDPDGFQTEPADHWCDSIGSVITFTWLLTEDLVKATR